MGGFIFNSVNIEWYQLVQNKINMEKNDALHKLTYFKNL